MILIECPSKDLKTTLKSISKVSRKKGTLIDIISDGCGIVNMRCSDPADTFSFTDTLECVASEHETSMSVNAKLFRKIIDVLDDNAKVTIKELDKDFVCINNYIIERVDYKSLGYSGVESDRFWIEGKALREAVWLSALPLSKETNSPTWGGINPMDFVKVDRVENNTIRFSGSNGKLLSSVDAHIGTNGKPGVIFGKMYTDGDFEFAIPMKRIPIVQELARYAQRVDVKVNMFQITISSEYSEIVIKRDDWKFPTNKVAKLLAKDNDIRETLTSAQMIDPDTDSKIIPLAPPNIIEFITTALPGSEMVLKTTSNPDDPILMRHKGVMEHHFAFGKSDDG